MEEGGGARQADPIFSRKELVGPRRRAAWSQLCGDKGPFVPPPPRAGRSWPLEAGGPWHPGGEEGLASGGLDPGKLRDCV